MLNNFQLVFSTFWEVFTDIFMEFQAKLNIKSLIDKKKVLI